MGRYFPVCAIQVEHEFFEGCPESNRLALRFLPSAACAEMMRQENLIVRERPNGIEVWREERPFVSQVSALRTIALTFLVSSSDPLFNSYTKWDCAKPIVLSHSDSDSNVIHLTAASAVVREPDSFDSRPGLSLFEKRRDPVQFAVQLQQRLGDQANAAMTQYVVALKAPPMHWKYFFTGVLAKKKLEIVDLEGGKTGSHRFTLSENGVQANSVAFLSEVPLPIKSMSTQRFQLREQGAAGRVLMRRLPNASIDKVGKERGPDGQSLIVAEIYIHQ